MIILLYKESSIIELKESYTASMFKTVSAYSNYRNGKIYIGIDDNGEVIGVNTIGVRYI